MIIGGFQKFSLIDFPGKSCAIIFTRGCNFRCPYCHNLELVWPEKFEQEIGVDAVLGFLRKRRGLLEGVTITGGEPSLHGDLSELAAAIKAMGYAVKLDTNGSKPEVLKEMTGAGLLDYIAMDVKAPLDNYIKASGIPISPLALLESIQLIMASGIAYEFRTTVDRTFLNEDDLLKIAGTIQGAKKYYLQVMNQNEKAGSTGKRLDDEIWLRQMVDRLSAHVDFCGVR